jgi:hypothetical protein
MIVNPPTSPDDLAGDPECRQLVDDLRDAHELAKRLWARAAADGACTSTVGILRTIAREIGGAMFTAELNIEVLDKSRFESDTPDAPHR